ncbi:MAG: uncharacterized protein KVP18_002052 [Porospora cf. gigantea A]|uniref:uncharacterized protein n=1 Tax=Porospora cf. gigantea A TaxID=2853593 RepID=UPI0035597DA4|nr:MAG: hypothetical protein KVP18_002052 [Porospora cf. gigantea A]
MKSRVSGGMVYVGVSLVEMAAARTLVLGGAKSALEVVTPVKGTDGGLLGGSVGGGVPAATNAEVGGGGYEACVVVVPAKGREAGFGGATGGGVASPLAFSL